MKCRSPANILRIFERGGRFDAAEVGIPTERKNPASRARG